MRPRSLVLLFAFTSTLGGAACANSSPIIETGSGGAGGVESSDVSSSSEASSSSSGGEIIPCNGGVTPCKLTAPQCGCLSTEQCTTDPKTLDPTYRVCTAAGVQGAGQKCMNGSCGPGTVCTQKVAMPLLSTCAAYCDSDADCTAPGGLCVLTLSDGKGGSIPNAALCTENCDPIAGKGCVPELACRVDTEPSGLLRSYTRCLAAGGGGEKSPCTVNADCGAGLTCVNSGANNVFCARYCTVGGNSCTGGLQCTALKANGKDVVLGGTVVGACL